MPEYWIVNLVEGVIEVYRAPSSGGYAERHVFERGQQVRLDVLPDVLIAVEDVIPGTST